MVIRRAQATDVEAILEILIEVASQVPVELGTSEHVEKMKEIISPFCLNDVSLVAESENGAVVGFQLAERRVIKGDRSGPDQPYIFLAYAGVTAPAAGQKVFRRLIEGEKEYGLPLVTEIKPDNKSCMAARLEHHYSFHPHMSSDSIGNCRWDPE
jgi:hypothetical protein